MKTRVRDIWRFLANSRNYNPSFNPPVRYILKNKWDIIGRVDTVFYPAKDLAKYQLFVTERILEYPFVHRVLNARGDDRILEFGCANSLLCIELANRGLNVWGVDLRPHPLSHPNFSFLQGDFFDNPFEPKSFDAIIAVSAVEHVGLGAYSEAKKDRNSDSELVDMFYSLLRPGGQLILTVPFGRQKYTKFYRIYDSVSLGKLLRKFVVECEEYYVREGFSIWMPTSAAKLSEVDWLPTGAGSGGVALISARRPQNDGIS